MPLSARGIRKQPLADAAFKLPPLTAMRHPVAIEVRALKEAALADVANEATPMRFIVGCQVLLEVVKPGKLPAAPRARVAPPRRIWVVRPQMAPQTSVLSELLTAGGAGVEHLAIVPCLMFS